jgi:hypothetical protein
MDFILQKNQKFIFVHGKILAVERKKKKQSFLFWAEIQTLLVVDEQSMVW